MRKTDTRRRCLAAFFLALAAASPGGGEAQTKPQAKNVLKDRVLAVVDEDPILSSDLDRVIKLGLQQPNPGETDERFRRRVLDDLIEERLRFHEIDRFGFEQVPVAEIEENVAKIRARFPDEAAFKKALKEVGLDLQGLRQLVARQLLVLIYVDERLGARVFVSLDDIQKYHRTELAAEMQKQGQPLPPLDDVRDQIREVLKQRKLNQELATWTNELRAEADVVVYPDSAGNPLPPVMKRIEKKGEAKKKP
jgi:parvulin-like peptidyl-prolyl isomerase